MRLLSTAFSTAMTIGLSSGVAQADDLPEALNRVIENHCADYHDDLDPKGGLDLVSLEWDLDDAQSLAIA